jgi:aryl-alcohol dehydrogenase-like predicted oxidoreductase
MHGLDGSLARLGLKTIDLYYVHFPLPLMDVRIFAEGLVEAVKSGKARAVGVANFNAGQMRRIADHLARAGVPLAANQVNYSLLHRAAETNGVLDACREFDVALVAYFPLASALVSERLKSTRSGSSTSECAIPTHDFEQIFASPFRAPVTRRSKEPALVTHSGR